MNELYRKHRPKTLEDLVGQDSAVATLRRLLERGFPHGLLITGPSGTGKTTIARILRRELKCSKIDYREIDCASVDPLETIRAIKQTLPMSPMGGACRIWFLEEAQSLSRAGFSQQAMLKLIEDAPSHAYIFLASTDPQKLIKTIHTRCTEVRLSSFTPAVLQSLLKDVAQKEGMKVGNEVLEEIAVTADGSARKALVILEQAGSFSNEAEQVAAIANSSVNKIAAINLARLLANPRTRWPEVAKLLEKLTDEPEGVRMLVLSYFRSMLLRSGDSRAFMIIEIFGRNFYDSRQAGLAAACWEVIHPMKS